MVIVGLLMNGGYGQDLTNDFWKNDFKKRYEMMEATIKENREAIELNAKTARDNTVLIAVVIVVAMIYPLIIFSGHAGNDKIHIGTRRR